LKSNQIKRRRQRKDVLRIIRERLLKVVRNDDGTLRRLSQYNTLMDQSVTPSAADTIIAQQQCCLLSSICGEFPGKDNDTVDMVGLNFLHAT